MADYAYSADSARNLPRVSLNEMPAPRFAGPDMPLPIVPCDPAGLGLNPTSIH